MKTLSTVVLVGALSLAGLDSHAGDRLLATGGVMQLEGSAGGGLTPWALIAGLGTDHQLGLSAFCTRVVPQDFSLSSCGLSAGIMDRVEVSVAHENLSLGTTVPGASIGMNVVGLKVRLLGDAVIDQGSWLPQLALGVQFKHNLDFAVVPKALGAKSANGTDVYVAATKIWLAGPLGRTWLADLTLRSTQGNQMGILGFGGDQGGTHIEAEGSVALFVSDMVVVGTEYRQKPDNLSVFHEDDFKDVFVAWFPVKYFSVTAAFADLGNIANKSSQRGGYLSLQASW